MRSFEQKQVVPIWKGEKLPIFCYKNMFTWKKVIFLAFFAKKLEGLVPLYWNFPQKGSGVLEQKPRKREFYGSSLSCSNWVPWSVRSNQSQSSTLGEPTNGSPVLKFSYLKQFTPKKMGVEVPVLQVYTHGAHVRGTKASWGDQKLVYLKTYFSESWGN